MKKTLIDIIQDEMLSDDEDREKQSQYFIDTYNSLTTEGQKKVNDLLISLCGWTYDSLQEKVTEANI
jgi:hypothetical protein